MKIVLSMLVAAGTLAATEILAQAPALAQSDREFRTEREALNAELERILAQAVQAEAEVAH